jgi:dsDNA-specific endonuclease/ATPase MutS2
MTEGYRKVFYIHGIGNGTLRNTLMDALKEFEDVKVRTAPFAQYGNGAIEVSFGAL